MMNARIMARITAHMMIACVALAASASAEQSSAQAQKENARLELSPHSVMIQSSLMSALDRIRGLRTEVRVGEEKKREPSAEFLQHYKMFSKEINSDVNVAKAHLGELDGSVAKFPQVARSDDYKRVDASFKDVTDLNSDWQAKVSSNAYWKNRDAVMKDLDRIEVCLNKALDETKSFNASQLDISSSRIG